MEGEYLIRGEHFRISALLRVVHFVVGLTPCSILAAHLGGLTWRTVWAVEATDLVPQTINPGPQEDKKLPFPSSSFLPGSHLDAQGNRHIHIHELSATLISVTVGGRNNSTAVFLGSLSRMQSQLNLCIRNSIPCVITCHFLWHESLLKALLCLSPRWSYLGHDCFTSNTIYFICNLLLDWAVPKATRSDKLMCWFLLIGPIPTDFLFHLTFLCWQECKMLLSSAIPSPICLSMRTHWALF